MIQPVVIVFLGVAALFAGVHSVAVAASLYWHFWWFDVLMHFWGGILITLGVMSLTTFRAISIRPSYVLVLSVAVVLVLLWELFEWRVGLLVPELHSRDAFFDVVVGIGGAVLGYVLIRKRNG